MKKILLLLVVFSVFHINAQSLENDALSKIKTLNSLISKAEKKGIDVLKEKTTVRTAEIFLKYANWDEKNIDKNTSFFEHVPIYKKEASKYAEDLPDFERNDVVKMLDEATSYVQLLIDKKAFRKPSPHVDWTKVTVDNDQLTFNNRPVFLADYTWKPKVKELTEYHGNQDGFFLTPTYVVKEDGTVNPSKIKELKEKGTGSLGFIFLNHKSVPKWSTDKFGKDFSMREDTYTAYDIDNPGARYIQSALLDKIVPFTAGKNYSKLGYMLCNEPHFFTQKSGDKLAWASGPVSNFTKDKFKEWLKNKHQSISTLNKLWGTNYTDFNEITIEIPIDTKLKGTPKWYDWTLFNMYRVTEWYAFLKAEILKNDSNGKVHLKIMPNLWTENERVHGIDLEALTDMSGIIGNDSGAEHMRMWGPEYEWEKHYAFEWRELCMGYDFMKSVSPNKINFNSELHYLSTNRSRNLTMEPAYARATFWLAHIYGMTASQIWFWPRKEDGSIVKLSEKGYAGSNNHQPRITNEVAMTMIDLNAYSEEIMAMQRQRKPIRIFYSKTSAINKAKHMDDMYEVYEALNFEGVPLGFVTQDIFNKQDASNWDVTLIYKTPFVTQSELNSIQKQLDNGAIIIIDNESLKTDEYGNTLLPLKESKGKLLKIEVLSEIKKEALAVLAAKNTLPEITIAETNAQGIPTCIWRTVKNDAGKTVLSVVNVGKTATTLTIKLNGDESIVCKDLLKGISTTSKPVLKPNELFFVEVSSK